MGSSRRAILLLGALLFCCAGPQPPRIPAAAEQDYRAGLAAESAGNAAVARARYARAVARAPEYPDAQIALLQAIRRQSGDEAAARHARAVADQPATGPEGKLLLALLEGDPRRKQSLLEQSLALRPSLRQAAYQLGLLHREHARFDQALGYFEQVLDADRRDARAHEQASYCHFRLFRWREALYHAHQTLELEPRAVRPRIFLAVDRLIKRDYGGAIEHYRTLRRHHPAIALSQEEQTIFLLAYRGALARHRIALWVEQGRKLAEEAVRAFPHSGMTHGFLGYFRDLGLPELQQALALDPYRLQTVQDLRRALLRAGRYAEALGVWRRIVPEELILRPDNEVGPRYRALFDRLAAAGEQSDAAALAGLARALRDAGWLEESVICYGQAMRRTSSSEEAAELAAERSRVAAVRHFLHELRLHVRRHYRRLERSQGGLSLAELRDFIARRWPGRPAPDLDRDLQRWFVFVREANPFAVQPGSFAAALARYNLVFDAGDNNGYVDLRVMRLLFRKRLSHPVGRRAYPYTVLVTDETVIDNYLGYLSGHPRISGRAFLSRQGFYVALDTIRPSRQSLTHFLAPPPSQRTARGKGGYHRGLDAALRRRFLARFGIRYPQRRPDRSRLDAAYRAYLTGFVQNVWLHELGHLVDFERYVPLANNLGANAWVALRCGLSPSAIELRFERTAETFSLATTRFPYLSLQDNLDRLQLNPDSLFYMVLVAWQKKDPRDSPYYIGAQKILRAMLDGAGLAAPEKLAGMEPGRIRALARGLCREEGIPFEED